MLPAVAAPGAASSPSGFTGRAVPHGIGAFLIGSAFISTETSMLFAPHTAWPATHGSLNEITMASD